jgi:hypothetical protein
MKLFNIIIIILFSNNIIFGQYTAQVTASYSPTSIPVNGTSDLTLQLNNTGIQMNSGTFAIQIQFPISKYTPSTTTPPTGVGAGYFNWSYLGSGLWYGTQIATIPAIIGGGPIVFSVTGVMITSPSAFTQINTSFPNGGSNLNTNTNTTTPAAGLIVSSALPVNISEFNARSADCQPVNLVWTTESEVNNKGFNIERSFGGHDFEVIGFVESNHNSTTSNKYSFIDERMEVNGDYNYRLVAVDYDGLISISLIESIKRRCDEASDLIVYPNPAIDKINVFISSHNGGIIKAPIMDNSGKIIKVLNLNLNIKNDVFIGDLPPGIYSLKVELPDFVNSKKFIKIE